MNDFLPKNGLSRAQELLPFLPFGQATLWSWSKSGKFPAPIKISPTITAWKNSDVHEWLELQSEGIEWHNRPNPDLNNVVKKKLNDDFFNNRIIQISEIIEDIEREQAEDVIKSNKGINYPDIGCGNFLKSFAFGLNGIISLAKSRRPISKQIVKGILLGNRY